MHRSGFSIQEQKGVRQVDIIFFFHGTVSHEKKFELEPYLMDANQAQLALVPENTYVYGYGDLTENQIKTALS